MVTGHRRVTQCSPSSSNPRPNSGEQLHRHQPIMALAASAALITGCAGPDPTAQRELAERTAAPISGSFPVGGGRSLAIDCTGSGPVTVILEVGFDAAGTVGDWTMRPLRDRLTPRYRVCNYDRANLGGSDPAPKPRTTGDIADDLAALLKAARVPGPYLLVGGSAGGLYVQHFAARHPTQVIAVLALNPELPEDEFMARAFPRFTAEEKARERDYASGKSPDSSQGIDLLTSAEQIKSDGPVPVPLTIMESQNNTCPSDDKTCNKLVDIGPKINRSRVAAAAPGGSYIPVTASHNLDRDIPDKIATEIDRLAALSN